MKHASANFCRTIVIGLLLAGCEKPVSSPAATPPGPQPQALATIELSIGSKTFTLQVADNDQRRETGLMYVHSMPADRGMIFLFPTERVLNFWMHNTPIDLDIIYANHAGQIVAIKTMHAYDDTGIPSDDPADVAIELNAGVAKTTGLAVGDKLSIPTELRAKAR